MLIFSILVPFSFLIISLVFFYLCKLLFSDFFFNLKVLVFVRSQSNSKYRDWAPLSRYTIMQGKYRWNYRKCLISWKFWVLCKNKILIIPFSIFHFKRFLVHCGMPLEPALRSWTMKGSLLLAWCLIIFRLVAPIAVNSYSWRYWRFYSLNGFLPFIFFLSRPFSFILFPFMLFWFILYSLFIPFFHFCANLFRFVRFVFSFVFSFSCLSPIFSSFFLGFPFLSSVEFLTNSLVCFVLPYFGWNPKGLPFK